MNSITRFDPCRDPSTVQDEVNGLFERSFKGHGDNPALTTGLRP